MYMALNTFLCEVGEFSLAKTIQTAKRFGFKYVDLACYKHADPVQIPAAEVRDGVKMFKDFGLVSSQLLLANTQDIAASDPAARRRTQDYMRRCADLQLELGGKQLIICWGCGVYETGYPFEASWMHMIEAVREFGRWCAPKGLYVGMELDPHVYFILNNMEKMVRALEQIGLDNVYPNIDIGHLNITREAPVCLDKVADRIYHVHISETDTFSHTNSIIGSGKVDFPAYVRKCVELGFEANCRRIGEEPVLGLEMGEPGHFVPDVEHWIAESLAFMAKTLPEIKLA